MKAHEPLRYITGTVLTPSQVNQNLRQLSLDIQDNLNRRFTYSSFELDYSGLTNASNSAEFAYDIPTLFPYDIVGVEIFYYGATTNTVTLTISGSGVSGAETVAAVAAGTSTRAYASANFTAQVTGSNNVTYTISSSSGAFTLTSCKVLIHIRTDRGNAGGSHTGYDPTIAIVPGATTDQLTLLNEYIGVGVAVTRDQQNNKRLRMQVVTRRSITAAASIPSSDQDVYLPVGSFRSSQLTVGVVCTNTSSVRAAYRTSGGVSSGSATVTGAGGSRALTSTAATISMTVAALADYTIRLSRTAGSDAVQFLYAVAYFT